MRLLLDLFVSFFKIGSFTIGGGYAMIPLFEEEFIRRRKWFTDQDFLDMLTVATAAPGPLAINSAVFTGYQVAGVPGVLVSIVGCILSPVIVILLIATNYEKFRAIPSADQVFAGIRPAVVGLMFAAVFSLVKRNPLRWTWYILSGISLVLIAFFKVDPVFVIAGSALSGVAFQRSLNRRRSS